MKLTATMAILAGIAGSANARHLAEVQFSVPVCMATPSADLQLTAARVVTGDMFRRIGVKIEWHAQKDCPAGALKVSISAQTPADLKPGALAYATPFDGTHIVLFLDRIHDGQPKERIPLILGYVMAHEITHILEGIPRHSRTGLMKARWDESDYFAIATGEMTFAQEDVDLIYLGAARRTTLAAAADQR